VNWVSAAPDVLVCVGLFLAPGLLATCLGGLRGITAWAMAPLVTVAVVTVVAVAGGWFGFRFGVWPVAAGTLLAAGLSAGLSLLLRARRLDSPARDPRSYSLAVVIGAVVAVVVGAATFIAGVRRPDAIQQSWDSVFHYNAIRYIEQTGQASPLTIGTLGQPGGKTSFYPDAWHLMAALLAELTGATVPVAAAVTCLVVAVLVITGMVSSLFGAFPWMLTGAYGILWPNALGLAMAPAGVALGMSVIRVSDGDTFGPVRRWFFAAAGGWAIAIAHPNSALSVAVILVFPLLVVVGKYAAAQYRRHGLATTLVAAGIVAVIVIGVFIASRLQTVRFVAGISWHPFETPPHALVSAFSNGTDRQAPELLLAAFSIIGMFACFVWRQRRWLVCAELVIAALYVGSAAIGSPARLFTGLWFDDSYRIAAILPVVAIPLTTMGVLAAAEWLQRVPFRAAVAARPVLAIAVPLAVGVVIAGATAVQGVPRNASTVGLQFNSSGDETLVSRSKVQFLQTVARLVPSSALVAENPFDGTAYLFALSGTRVLFPQMNQSTNPDVVYLAHHLVDLGQDTRVCDLVRQYGVGYMVVAPDDFLTRPSKPGVRAELEFYAGVAYPGADPAGFRLIASAAGGQLRLYKITMCQSPSARGQVEAVSRGS
jgi:hypothetical protein